MSEQLKKIMRLGIPCNILLIAANAVLFFYSDLFADLTDAGALDWYRVLYEGQWYRVITYMFLHSDIGHLLNNMLVLAFMGSALEQEIGSLWYGIFYLGTGIVAGFSSMIYNMSQDAYIVSVGASGAIFGTVGAMLYLVIFYKDKRLQYSPRQMLWLAFLTLYSGFATQGVDNAAHVGGFISGFIFAPVLCLAKKHAARHTLKSRMETKNKR